MCTAAAPDTAGEAVRMLHAGLGLVRSAAGFLAASGAAGLPAEALAGGLRDLEGTDAAGAAARGALLEAFDAADGPVGDGQRTARAWLVHVTGVTKGQAGEHQAVQRVARSHPVLNAALAEGVVSKSAALQLAKWIRMIPEAYRAEAEEIVVGAARAGAGADLRALARICAEIRYRTARPDPDDDSDKHLDRGVSFDTTFGGAGVLRGDLTPECTAMVQAVLDALSAPAGGGDLRTRPQRYHDALAEAMRRLLASGLLPKRAGQPVKALVHISFAELCDRDADSALQDKWIGEYRARWAAHRAATSVSTGDGGAWLEGDAARAIACDAMIVPVVMGDIDPGAVEELILLCVRYHCLRSGTSDQTDSQDGGPNGGHAVVPAGLIGSAARQAQQAAAMAEVLAGLEQQILGTILQVVSGPGGMAHRADGGRTSLTNLKDYCWWHHHVVLHQLGWTLTAYPDGTSQVTSPTGKVIRSHSPPRRD